MKRVVTVVAVVVVLLSGIVPVGIWLLVRDQPERLPQISAYSRGQLIRVSPYLYCPPLNLDDCKYPAPAGELRITERHPVQLSVPAAIARAPWKLRLVYEDTVVETTIFRPDTRLAVTIAPVDEQHGRLAGLAVQLLTVIPGPGDELIDIPHAEWSVQMVWP